MSNNGSQHLSALTKDEITAPHVNLVPLELPGDLYRYVAEHVWTRLEEQLKILTKEEIEACQKLIDNLIDLKRQINEAEPKSERRKELISKIQSFKDKNRELLEIAAPVYWSRIYDLKERRKIVKRYYVALVKQREFGEYPSRTIPSQASVKTVEGVETIPQGSTLKRVEARWPERV
jgi:hypothetical protein